MGVLGQCHCHSSGIMQPTLTCPECILLLKPLQVSLAGMLGSKSKHPELVREAGRILWQRVLKVAQSKMDRHGQHACMHVNTSIADVQGVLMCSMCMS